MTTGGTRQALLDTSVLIDFSAAQVAEFADDVAVSAVTIAVLHFGVTATADPLVQLHRRRRVQAILDHLGVLPFDVDVAPYYGTLATLAAFMDATHGHAAWTSRSPRPQRAIGRYC